MSEPRQAQPSPAPAADLRSLRPYLARLRDHPRDAILVHLFMLAATALGLAIPVQAGRFVDVLTGHFPQEPRGRVLALVCVLLVAQLAGTFVSRIVGDRLVLDYVARLRKRIFAHLLEVPSLFYGDQRGGDLSSRVTSDVGSVSYIVTDGLLTLARAALTLVGAVWLMLRLDVRLTLVIVSVVPATMLLVQLFGRRLHRLSRRMYEELGRISNHVQEISGAIRVVKSYNSQDHEAARFDGIVDSYRRAGFSRAVLSAALESASQAMLWVALIVVLVFGFAQTARGVTTHGQLVAFFLLAWRVAGPVSALTSVYASAQGAMAAAARLDAILGTPAERRRAGSPLPAFACRGEITLERVTFAYGERTVLHELDARIAAGEWIGVVGASGAGKTTLAGLLLRLFDPAAGRLLLDGRPFADYDLTDLRGQMAYVSQDPVLYDLTVAENIRFGLPDATDDEVRLAAQRAHALEFIERLPEGFATRCGERGQQLSGGERQRITLARAFLRNPRVLILDEPTSALDARAEEAVHAALKALMEGRTAIVIAHRLSTVRDLDRILVLSHGRLVEEGSHAQLLARDGLYAGLYRIQHGPAASPAEGT